MAAFLLILWLFFELIFTYVGLAIAKIALLGWRLLQCAAQRRRRIGPLFTAGDWTEVAGRFYFGVGVTFLVLILTLFAL